MANPAEIEGQVRFALTLLPDHNAHHVFEHICRHLTQQFICSNILPATGPVSAGGDQGRDFETFRTYLRKELGPHGAFLGLVSEGTVAFVCTTQANGLLGKLRQDIKKVCASGHPVHEICAFTLESVSAANRHTLETETWKSYKVRLEFHDAESIASRLATSEGFWIAEHFLSIPSEIQPEVAAANGDHSAEYADRRRKWRERGSPNLTLGDFIDLKTGLREAVFHQKARGDLPFWLGLLRQLLAIPGLPIHIQQRARYELVVATLRGTNEFQPVEDVARAYLDESLNESEPARLADASALLLFANAAVKAGLTSLTPAELRDWNGHLTSRIQELVTHVTPHRRASLLYALGHLGIHPVPSEADIQDLNDQAYIKERWDEVDYQTASADVSLPEDVVFTDTSRALSAWSELVDSLQEVPLFPIQTLADILQLLVPLWSKQAEWRELLDLVDDAVGERKGKHAIAALARDRAMKLLQGGRRLDALEEFHRAKIDWWSGETVRGSLLSMIIIAELYLELRLPHASKTYALAVAYIAKMKGDEKLADLIPAGLLMAANADFAAGAWCSALEMCELSLAAQHELIADGTDSEKHQDMVEDSLSILAHITACAKCVDPDLAACVDAMTERIGIQEIIADAVNELDAQDKDFWESVGDKELVARPFSDLGEERNILFSALGTDWSLVADNDIDSVRAVERFAAAAQVMLAALAQEDLCLVQTQIKVRIRCNDRVGTPDVEDHIESIPSNDGREWVVQLASVGNSANTNFEEHDIELLTILTTILREASLLPDDDFSVSLRRAFKSGLGHKLSPGRPYDQLVAAFTADGEPEIQRSRYITPWDCGEGSFAALDELRWQDGPGPTYSHDRAEELLQTRYDNLAKSLRLTVARLASAAEFRPTVDRLRARGWLDWHILTAIFNIVMNYRFPSDLLDSFSEEAQREMLAPAFGPESATAEPVPVGLFTFKVMNNHRQGAMLQLLNHWGLECQQETPDFPAIERLLAKRYRYWNADVPHADPFPSSGNGGINSGLAVLDDVPP